MTPDEQREQLIEKMGRDLGTLCYLLRQEIILLHSKWRQFHELYGKSEQRIALMNSTAPYFFGMLQEIFWDDILLHIARLVDEPGQADRAVLTIERITPLVRDTPIRKAVSKRLRAARAATQFVRPWRNKRVAHRDLANLLKQSAEPLTGGTSAEVEAALTSFRDLYNEIGGYFCKSHMDFELAGTESIGAAYLLRLVLRGQQAEKEGMERMRKGTASPDEWGPGPSI